MKKKIQKFVLATASVCAFASSAFAAGEVKSPVSKNDSGIQVELKAYAGFQAGFRTQNHLSDAEKNLSANHRNMALFNDAALFANLSNEVDEFKYGGKIVLVPTASRKAAPSYNGSHLFIETELGRVEVGSPMSAFGNMNISGTDIAVASGADDWGSYARFSTEHLQNGTKMGPAFASFSEYFMDSKLVTNTDSRVYSNEPSRRISLYSPKFEVAGEATKVQFGISYTPDSSNTGADTARANSNATVIKDVTANNVVEKFVINRAVKDTFSGGVALEQNISDGVDLKVAVAGEYGKAAGKAERQDVNKTVLASYKLADLRTYNIGAILNIGSFSYSASYGSLGKSLTAQEVERAGRKTDYYSGAVAYKYGPFGTSLAYFRSNQYKNTVDAISLGADYLMAPGFKPYAEVTTFNLKGAPEYFTAKSKKSSRGTVALIGAKLSL